MISRKRFRLIYLFITFASLPTAAEPGAVVWTRGTPQSAARLFKPGSNVRIVSADEEAKVNKKSGFLDPDERDEAFRRAGVESKVVDMDQFDKDMLAQSARSFRMADLRRDYPKFSEAELKRLQKEVRRGG